MNLSVTTPSYMEIFKGDPPAHGWSVKDGVLYVAGNRKGEVVYIHNQMNYYTIYYEEAA